MSQSSYRFHVGDFDVLMIKDGGAPRPASGFLASAPQDELARILHEQGLDPNVIDSAITPIVIRTNNHTYLVDTGLGGDRGNLPAHLKENGLDVADIDTIIITHGHGDHVGGIVDAAGEFVFPNADYVFWSTEWEYWAGGEPPAGAHPLAWNTLKAHPDRIRTIGGDQTEAEIAPGLCAIAAPGHTIGHIGLELTSRGEQLLHLADAAHHWFQLQCPQWSPNFDYDKEQAAVTRKTLFDRAARSGELVSAYHFPFPGLGHVREQDGKETWAQAASI